MTATTRPILVVSFTPSMLKDLQRLRPGGSAVLVEEPDVIRKRDFAAAVALAPAGRELIGAEYQRAGGADRFFLEHRDLDPVAVIPGSEYAVPAAARLAERYGVPGAGLGAAEVLRDKSLTRAVTAAAGIANPASREVTDLEEVRAFQRETEGPVILKPANRQAAVGTVIVTDPAALPAAWTASTEQDEGPYVPDRGLERRMLVEQLISGDEFSVEMLVRDGRRLFANVTAKQLVPGDRPVERGHVVPAAIDAAATARLVAQTERVVAAAGFGTGVVHCEWIVQDGVPYLVECAGRLPGDWIVELIDGAYGGDLVGAYLDLMSGGSPALPPAAAVGGAAVRFLVHEPGEVTAIEGLEKAARVEGVRTCQALIGVGAVIPPLRSSWDRAAVVTAVGADTREAVARAEQAIGLVDFCTT